jgi:hypothetical protein
MKSSSFAVLAALGAALAPLLAGAQSLSIGPPETVSVGDATTVDLDINGLGTGSTVGAFDVTVGFNPSFVSFASATYGGSSGDLLNPGGPTQGFDAFTTAGTGTAEVAEFSLLPTLTQPSGFTLAQLTFDGVAAGTSALTLSVNALGDQYGNSFSATLQDGTIAVTSAGGGPPTSVPEIDPKSAAGAFTLLIGTLVLIRGRRVRSHA